MEFLGRLRCRLFGERRDNGESMREIKHETRRLASASASLSREAKKLKVMRVVNREMATMLDDTLRAIGKDAEK